MAPMCVCVPAISQQSDRQMLLQRLLRCCCAEPSHKAGTTRSLPHDPSPAPLQSCSQHASHAGGRGAVGGHVGCLSLKAADSSQLEGYLFITTQALFALLAIAQ